MNLNQVTVPSTNIERSISFYIAIGLQLIVKSPHYARFLCPAGDATFSIILEKETTGGSGIHIYFECHELDKQVAQLSANGISFLEMPNDKPWLWREAHLKDPDGNHLVLYYAGSNRIHPPWRINP